MASRPPQSVPGVSRATAAALSRAGIRTCGELVLMPDLQLMHAASASLKDVKGLQSKVCRLVRPKPVTVLDMVRAREAERGADKSVPTGLPELDTHMHGGIPSGSVTELVGPAGAGKTQLSMTLAVFATLPSALGGVSGVPGGGGVVYIDTENKFSGFRLVEIAKSRFPMFYGPVGSGAGSGGDTATDGADADDLLVDPAQAAARVDGMASRVRLFRVNSAAELVSCIKGLETTIIDNNIQLVILDSIASVLRREFGADSFVERQDVLSGTAAALKSVADTFHIPVVVTNQVTTNSRGRSSASVLQPALGNTWAHCVNTRLLLESGLSEGARVITLLKSAMAGKKSLGFKISGGGIVSAPLPQDQQDAADGRHAGAAASEGLLNNTTGVTAFTDAAAASSSIAHGGTYGSSNARGTRMHS